MWFIDIEVEQETSAPPPKKNPGSAPGEGSCSLSSQYFLLCHLVVGAVCNTKKIQVSG